MGESPNRTEVGVDVLGHLMREVSPGRWETYVPAADHQRVVEQLAQRETECAAMRATGPAVCDMAESILDHSESLGEVCRAGDGRPCEAHRRIRAHRASLSSSAGRALLEEMEGLRASVEILRSEQVALAADVKHAEAESADLRARVEAAEDERDRAVSRLGDALIATGRAVEEAVAKERERAAQVVEAGMNIPCCEGEAGMFHSDGCTGPKVQAHLAAAIRSRSK